MAIKECLCDHGFQDSRYGNKKRVANEQANGSFRCTVCGQTIIKSTTVNKAKKVAAKK